MSIKFIINTAGLRQLGRELAKNIKRTVQAKLPAGTKVADSDAGKIARQVTSTIESALKRLG